MPAMITTCPGCGRKGIMSKATGVCVHCSKGATKPKIEPAPPERVREPVASHGGRGARTSVPKVVRGRRV